MVLCALLRSLNRHIFSLLPMVFQCNNKAFDVKLKGSAVVKSDCSSLIEVSINPSMADFGATVGEIMIITNDPQQPSKRLKVTAIVEK